MEKSGPLWNTISKPKSSIAILTTKRRFALHPQAQKAKSLGASKEFPIRHDWDTYREEVMRKALKAKFEQNPELKQLLLSTQGRPLYEATTDPYWGQGRTKKGKNRLGILLMELRDSMGALKEGQSE